MKKTTDIAGWLDDNEPQDEQDRADLLAAIQDEGEKGNYASKKRGRLLTVTGWSGLTLELANASAKARLIREVEALEFDEPQMFRDVGSHRKA